MAGGVQVSNGGSAAVQHGALAAPHNTKRSMPRPSPVHAVYMQEGGRLGEAAELYESILRHFAGGAAPPAADAPAVADASSSVEGSLLDVPPSAVANLCVCYVIGSQNEAAEELLRRLEDETTAAEAGSAGTAGAAAVPPHLSLANLAIGTLYCSKGGHWLMRWWVHVQVAISFNLQCD